MDNRKIYREEKGAAGNNPSGANSRAPTRGSELGGRAGADLGIAWHESFLSNPFPASGCHTGHLCGDAIHIAQRISLRIPSVEIGGPCDGAHHGDTVFFGFVLTTSKLASSRMLTAHISHNGVFVGRCQYVVVQSHDTQHSRA